MELISIGKFAKKTKRLIEGVKNIDTLNKD